MLHSLSMAGSFGIPEVICTRVCSRTKKGRGSVHLWALSPSGGLTEAVEGSDSLWGFCSETHPLTLSMSLLWLSYHHGSLFPATLHGRSHHLHQTARETKSQS